MAATIQVARLSAPLITDTSDFSRGLAKAGQFADRFVASFASNTDRLEQTLSKVADRLDEVVVGLSKIDDNTDAVLDLNNTMEDLSTSVEDVTNSTDNLEQAFSDVSDDAVGMGKKTTSALTSVEQKMSSVVKKTSEWGDRFKTAIVNVGVALLAAGIGKLVRGIGRGVVATARMVAAAAPLPGIAAAFDSNASRFGVSLDKMRKAARGTIPDFELMKNANIALVGAGEEFGQLFGKELPTLLAAARAASRATGKDVGYLYNSLVEGVKKSTPLLIDNTGLVLKVGEANKKMAESLGITVEQLSAEQKQIALLTSTVDAAQGMIAQFGSETLTTAEKLQVLRSSGKNFIDRVGVGFQPVLDGLLDKLQALGGRVLPLVAGFIENKVVPAVGLLVDGLGGLAEKAVTAAENFSSGFGGKLLETAKKALVWGINISTQLATGIIQGAASALTAAMNWVGGLLAGWLSPGSPPRIAPDIDKWGTSAMSEWIGGMTGASFDALEGMQRPLNTALSRMVESGALTPEQSQRLFRGLSTGMAKAMAEFERTGKISTEIFDRLEKATGGFGKDLAKLARLQMKVAVATKRVKEAEEALEKARAHAKTSQDEVSKAADAYNKALAEGADPATLRRLGAQFEKAREQAVAAEKQVKAEENKKTEAEKNLSLMKEQLSVQSKLVEQMFRMTEPLTKVAETLAALAGEKGGMPEIEMPAPNIPPIDFSGMFEGFDEKKAALLAKLGGLFAPVTKAWEEDIQPTLEGLSTKWAWFTGVVRSFWDEKVQPVIDEFKLLVPPEMLTKIGKLIGKVLVAGVVFKVLAVIVGLLASPVIALTALVVAAVVIWEIWGKKALAMHHALQDLKRLLVEAVIKRIKELGDELRDNVLDAFKKLRSWVVDKMMPKLREFHDKYLVPIRDVFVSINDALKNTIDRIAKFLDKVGELAKASIPDWLKRSSPSPIEMALGGMRREMGTLNRREIPQFSANMRNMPSLGSASRGDNYDQRQMELHVHTQATTSTVVQDWDILAAYA